jgi:hypothetical protein
MESRRSGQPSPNTQTAADPDRDSLEYAQTNKEPCLEDHCNRLWKRARNARLSASLPELPNEERGP